MCHIKLIKQIYLIFSLAGEKKLFTKFWKMYQYGHPNTNFAHSLYYLWLFKCYHRLYFLCVQLSMTLLTPIPTVICMIMWCWVFFMNFFSSNFILQLFFRLYSNTKCMNLKQQIQRHAHIHMEFSKWQMCILIWNEFTQTRQFIYVRTWIFIHSFIYLVLQL